MKVLITCGPACEPIDSVRRIINHSTGSLGIFLSNELSRKDHDVTCLIGKAHTCSDTNRANEVIPFFTTTELKQHIERLAKSESFDAILHAAALADYTVESVKDENGNVLNREKIESHHPSLTVHLKPAPKVISTMRSLFPKACIIGWKYELDDEKQAYEKAFRQIETCQTDACVLNGPAVGEDFIFCLPDRSTSPKLKREALASRLHEMIYAFGSSRC